MADNKELLDITRALQQFATQATNAAKSLGETSEKLSNSGVDEFSKELKKTLKAQNLLSDEQLESVKSFRELQKVLEVLEKNYDIISDIEVGRAKVLKDELARAKRLGLAEEGAIKLADKWTESTLLANKITQEQYEALKKGVPVLREEIEQRKKNISAGDKLKVAHENLTKSLKQQVAEFASFTTAALLLKKAFTVSYEQMGRLTNKGMLGAFTTMNLITPKLLLSAQEFEDIINKNRDLVNQMGGGTKGIEAFADEIGTVRKDLAYLGKDASKAATKMIEISKSSGLTPKDGEAYKKNVKATTEQFKRFQGIFGDTYEDYGNLMDSLVEEEQTRNRLNTMSKAQALLEMDEIRKRTENLKLMGLSNTQIAEFNKKVNALVDPRKNDFSERASSSIMMKQTVTEMSRMLAKGGTPEDQAMLAELEQNRAALDHIADLNQKGDQKGLADFMKTKEGADAAKAYNRAMAQTDKHDQYSRAVRNAVAGRTGALGATLDSVGKDLSTAEAQGKNLTGLPQEALDKIIAGAEEIRGENSATAVAFKAMTIAVEGVKQLFENPFSLAIMGAIAGLAAFAGANALAAATRGLGAFGGAIKGVLGKILGPAANLAAKGGMLGKAGAVGAAGYVGYQIGDKAVNPVLNKIAETATGTKGETFGTGIYGAVDKMQDNFSWMPGKSDAQKMRDAELGAKKSTTSIPATSAIAKGATTTSAPASASASTGGNTSGENPIAQILKAEPGYLIVKRPDGSTEKIKGSRNWRNNNPGNLEYNDFTRGLGAIGTDGRFAIFPNYETGKAAKAKLLFQGKNYKDLTLSQAIARYAPPTENNTGAYQNSVLASVGGANKKMNDFTPEEQNKILASMQKVEGFKAGETSTIIPSVSGPNTMTASLNPPFTGGTPAAAVNTANTAATSPKVEYASAKESSPSNPTIAMNETNNELKKQTGLLSQLVRVASTSGLPKARDDSYSQDVSEAMNS